MPDLYELATTELFGRAIFGKPGRLRLGMWLSTLPGRPTHTFTQKQYWTFCREHRWPGFGVSIRDDLDRFAHLEMVCKRDDLRYRGRTVYWSKLASPLWEVFVTITHVIQVAPFDPDYVPSLEVVDKTKGGLLQLARTLSDHG